MQKRLDSDLLHFQTDGGTRRRASDLVSCHCREEKTPSPSNTPYQLPLGMFPSSEPLGTPPQTELQRRVLVDGLQAAQQLVVRAAGHRHRLKDRLEGPAVQLLVNLVPVEVHGHHAEQVDIHHLDGAHSTDHMWESGGQQGELRAPYTLKKQQNITASLVRFGSGPP